MIYLCLIVDIQYLISFEDCVMIIWMEEKGYNKLHKAAQFTSLVKEKRRKDLLIDI